MQEIMWNNTVWSEKNWRLKRKEGDHIRIAGFGQQYKRCGFVGIVLFFAMKPNNIVFHLYEVIFTIFIKKKVLVKTPYSLPWWAFVSFIYILYNKMILYVKIA